MAPMPRIPLYFIRAMIVKSRSVVGRFLLADRSVNGKGNKTIPDSVQSGDL